MQAMSDAQLSTRDVASRLGISTSDLAKQRLMDLVYQRRDLGSFGLGSERSIVDFAKHSGINYLTKSIVQPYQEGPYGMIGGLDDLKKSGA
jgi:hypothetical protein